MGLVPTLLAIGGVAALLLAARRRPAELAVALLSALGLLAYAGFAARYPTDDGDTIKGTYMLTTAAGWAFGFGYALDRLKGRWRQAALALVVASAVVELPFLIWNGWSILSL